MEQQHDVQRIAITRDWSTAMTEQIVWKTLAAQITLTEGRVSTILRKTFLRG
ncbi:hypothetical protein [Aliihoeflea sp. 40Bstr573]|uniref:hypothetical protein n=1 Tax=Aliihoeflea sp. 40Bstr573 TaxID=2696467 RepID=UPI002095890B|nr:hypothetical protein [Aliihoeflea sp. 40Bstr573]MCO6387493.1 hypothetical protein [Aliihoeflea sp. 40Bstr573]